MSRGYMRETSCGPVFEYPLGDFTASSSMCYPLPEPRYDYLRSGASFIAEAEATAARATRKAGFVLIAIYLAICLLVQL